MDSSVIIQVHNNDNFFQLMNAKSLSLSLSLSLYGLQHHFIFNAMLSFVSAANTMSEIILQRRRELLYKNEIVFKCSPPGGGLLSRYMVGMNPPNFENIPTLKDKSVDIYPPFMPLKCLI